MDFPLEAASGSLPDVLLADHRHAEALLERLVEAFEANDHRATSTLWTELERGLLAHMEAEEETLLPRIADPFPVAAAALLRDHLRIRQRLAALGIAVDLHAVRAEDARAFVDELRAHAQNEEQVLYRWADERLDAVEKSGIMEGFCRRLAVRASRRGGTQESPVAGAVKSSIA